MRCTSNIYSFIGQWFLSASKKPLMWLLVIQGEKCRHMVDAHSARPTSKTTCSHISLNWKQHYKIFTENHQKTEHKNLMLRHICRRLLPTGLFQFILLFNPKNIFKEKKTFHSRETDFLNMAQTSKGRTHSSNDSLIRVSLIHSPSSWVINLLE